MFLKSKWPVLLFMIMTSCLYHPTVHHSSTPVMLGQKVVQRYFRGEGYIECDVHVGSSAIADNIVGVCRSYSKAFICNLGKFCCCYGVCLCVYIIFRWYSICSVINTSPSIFYSLYPSVVTIQASCCKVRPPRSCLSMCWPVPLSSTLMWTYTARWSLTTSRHSVKCVFCSV